MPSVIFGNRIYRELKELNEIVKVEPNPVGLISLSEEGEMQRTLCTQRGRPGGGGSEEEVAVCKPGREGLPRNQLQQHLGLEPPVPRTASR